MSQGIVGGEYDWAQLPDGTYLIKDVEIFTSCEREQPGMQDDNPVVEMMDFGDEWLESALRNAIKAERAGHLPPLHMHHHHNSHGKAVEEVGALRLKRIEMRHFSGGTEPALIADLIVTDPSAFQAIKSKRLRYRSVEADYEGRKIRSMALLNDVPPWHELPMLTLSNLTREAVGDLEGVGFSASEGSTVILQETSTMKVKRIIRDGEVLKAEMEDGRVVPFEYASDLTEEEAATPEASDADTKEDAAPSAESPVQRTSTPSGGKARPSTKFDAFEGKETEEEESEEAGEEVAAEMAAEPMGPDGGGGWLSKIAEIRECNVKADEIPNFVSELRKAADEMDPTGGEGGMGGLEATPNIIEEPLQMEEGPAEAAKEEPEPELMESFAASDSRIQVLEAKLEARDMEDTIRVSVGKAVLGLEGRVVSDSIGDDLTAFAAKHGVEAMEKHAEALAANVPIVPTGGMDTSPDAGSMPEWMMDYRSKGPQVFEAAKAAYSSYDPNSFSGSAERFVQLNTPGVSVDRAPTTVHQSPNGAAYFAN